VLACDLARFTLLEGLREAIRRNVSVGLLVVATAGICGVTTPTVGGVSLAVVGVRVGRLVGRTRRW